MRVHLQERVQPRERRFRALVVVHARRVESVATAAGAVIVESLTHVVRAEKPAKRLPGALEPGAIAGHAERRAARRDRGVGLDRLLVEARTPPALLVETLIADGREASVDGL